MVSPTTQPGSIRFGPFALDPTSRELRKRGTLVKFQPQQIAVLLLLIERAGHIVSREEIHQHIWGIRGFPQWSRDGESFAYIKLNPSGERQFVMWSRRSGAEEPLTRYTKER